MDLKMGQGHLSQGLQGNIAHDTQGLTHGDNKLEVELNHMDLEEAPVLHLKIKGPNQKEAPLIIDLTEACIERLMVDLATRGTKLSSGVRILKLLVNKR